MELSQEQGRFPGDVALETVREWTLWRTEPDFSELSFAQRFIGIISDDGRSVAGRWAQSHDGGETWEPDSDLRLERRP